MKKILSIAIFILAMTQLSWAWDFTYTYSGKTLCYNITNSSTHTVEVTYQNSSGTRYSSLSGEINIPYTVTNGNTTYTVTGIDCSTFYNCANITSVSIPNSVTYIGARAFMGCSGLTSINLGNAVTTIGTSAFYGSGLTEITIPASVSTIEASAFANCSRLASVYYTGDVASWCEISFEDHISNPICYSHNIYIGGILVTDLVIPNTVTTISAYAFYNCSSGLTSVTIPNSVTNIGNGAFSYCSGLTEIHSHPTTPPTLGTDPFNGVSTNIAVYVPCGCMNLYNNTNWAYFTNISEEYAYNYSVTSANDNEGSVSIITAPTCSSPSVQIQATANMGYLFEHWSNGSTSNPYTLSITSDTMLIAYFTPIDYTITVATSNPSLGSVSGGGTLPYGTQTTIAATPNQGCRFTQWNDGDTTNPRTITVTENTTYSAAFSDQHIVTVLANDQSMGFVTGGGEYTYNTIATISATANQGYRFSQWNDGITLNPRNIIVTGNVTYTAIFVPLDYTIIVNSDDLAMGSVSGSGVFPYNSQTTITATPNDGYEFRQWSDGNTSNPRTITVTGNATYTAQFSLKRYTITVNSHNNSMGTTTGSGTYEYGTSVTISAEPKSGFAFDYWSDDHSNTSRVRTVTVTGNATYTAYFRQIPAGISSVETDSYNISTLGNRIVITTSGDEPVYVYDITGRLISKTRPQGGELSVQVPQLGVYMVKVGNSPAHKVVVR